MDPTAARSQTDAAQVFNGGASDVLNRTLTAPISMYEAHFVSEYCRQHYDGKGIPDGATPCRPTESQVDAYCAALPALQPKPHAFVFFEEHIGRKVPALTCPTDTCVKFRWMAKWDLLVTWLGSCTVFFAVFCLRPVFNHFVDWFKQLRVRSRNQEKQEGIRGRSWATRSTRSGEKASSFW